MPVIHKLLLSCTGVEGVCWAASISQRVDFCTGIHLCLIIVQLYLIRSSTSLSMLSVQGYSFNSWYRIDGLCMFVSYGKKSRVDYWSPLQA